MTNYIRCRIPESIPTRYDFFCELTDTVFPELCGKNEGYSAYTRACMSAAKQVGLIDEDEIALGEALDDYIIKEESDFFRLMFEMNEAHKFISSSPKDVSLMDPANVCPENNDDYKKEKDPKEKKKMLTIRAYKVFDYSFGSFCENNTTRTWRTPPTDKKSGDKAKADLFFEGASFFTYLLLKRPECKHRVLPFFEKCLGYLGIEIKSDIIRSVLGDFGFEYDEHNISEHADAPFHRLANRSTALLGIAVMTVLEHVGKYSAETAGPAIERFHDIFEKAFEAETLAQDTVNRLQSNLFSMLSIFEPRSIDAVDAKLQDVFTLPAFEKNGKQVDAPNVAISNATSSERSLIVSKTGLGKTVYLQMLTLCTLKDAFEENLKKNLEACTSDELSAKIKASAEKLRRISAGMSLPEGSFVINIPAKMFSTLYSSQDYKEYTKDFVTLFFQAVCNLSDKYHFYTREKHGGIGRFGFEEKISPEIYKYILYLARKGRLILVLDSFDEVAPGKMRIAYINAVKAFTEKYCNINGSGAHIILATREMSPDTMASLESTVNTTSETYYKISPLDSERRLELITNWSAYKPGGENPKDDFSAIEDNHIRRELASSPYMLSVLYWNLSRNTNEIVDKYISALKLKMMRGITEASGELKSCIDELCSRVIPSIALESVRCDRKTISNSEIREATIALVKSKGLYEEESEADEVVERLFNIIVTEVGLIVPADGRDDAFQFIEDIIRYHLAAKQIADSIRNEDEYSGLRKNMLDGLSVESYVKLFIPLLANGRFTVHFFASLVSELAFRSFETECENGLLVVAAADVLLASYGLSYATSSGGTDAQTIKRIQRTLLAKILTADCKVLSSEDKKRLLATKAWNDNADFFSKSSAATLNG